jgi:hypothetical protein
VTDKPKLTPANENPWYVLMTLYGEQDGEGVDVDLHRQNRAVWNAWSCQQLDDDAAAELAKQARVIVAETRGWAQIATEVKSKHRAEMKTRNDDDFTYPGFPDFESEIQCSEIQFCNILVLERYIFTQPANFNPATFTRNANFSRATFTQHAYFTSATFTRDANFSRATFTQDANFNSATFTQDADFTYATFTQNAYFSRATIFTQNADFTYATFTQDAFFLSATFMQDADFSFATFTQAAYFFSATFTQTADFYSATFDGPAKFLAARFGVRDATEICVPFFTEAAFARLVSFRDAKFVTHYPVLEGTEFRETVVVTAKSTHWPKAGQPLLDQAAEGAKQVPTKEVAKESCATLRHALGKQGMPEEEHFFFTREMHHAGQIGSWFQRLPYRLFGWVSGYGGSIERPALGLIWLFLAPLGVYLAALGPTSLATFGKAMALSFASIFKFLGFQRTYFGTVGYQNVDIIVQMLTATQTVLSFILLFFLGLGLRTRFRLR